MTHRAPRAGVFVYLLAMTAAGDAVAAALSSTALHESWTFRQAGREESYPAKVPGVVHLDLLQNGLIGDPFYRDNEKGLQWVGKTDWEYRTEFAVAPGDARAPERRARLRRPRHVREGLPERHARSSTPTTCTAAGACRVAGKLKAKGNELRVVFRSPIVEDLAKVTASGYELPAVNDQGEKTSVYTRKAPYSFGWDWGPRFVTCGVWKPVRLEAWDDARIVDVAVRQKELGNDKATLIAEVEVLAAKPAKGARPAAAVEVDGGGRRRTGDPEGRAEGRRDHARRRFRDPEPEAVVAERLRRAAALHGEDAPLGERAAGRRVARTASACARSSCGGRRTSGGRASSSW